MEREARKARECQARQAKQEQREQQEQREKERQDHEEQQSESGESRPSISTASVHDRLGREHDEELQRKSDQSINTASVYDRVNRFCPSSPAARARRAVGAGSASVAPLGLDMFRKPRGNPGAARSLKSTNFTWCQGLPGGKSTCFWDVDFGAPRRALKACISHAFRVSKAFKP